MIKRFTMGAAAAAGLAFAAGAAQAQTYYTVEVGIDVEAQADVVWETVGDYCAIRDWVGPNWTCELTAGDGGLGSVRLLNDSIEEVLVGVGHRAYTYLQTRGSMAAATYIGSLSVQPTGESASRISYTLIWNEDALEPGQRETLRSTFTNVFQNALNNMKQIVEASP